MSSINSKQILMNLDAGSGNNVKRMCMDLLHAEHESQVEKILDLNSFLEDESAWQPLSGIENNFATVGNQQSEATGALIEKVINSIDAVLMAECYKAGIDPQGKEAPTNMSMAVERFFGIRGGSIESLGARERTKFAELVQLVATGSKEEPCYLIIDQGEGQVPANFPRTLLSITGSNRLRIPFVQGKFNMGGSGVLPFCGNNNYELIVSRRHPQAPRDKLDPSADLWGFTIVRRMFPSDDRPASMYVYLAPGGQVPAFRSSSIRVLPGDSSKNNPARAYSKDFEYGTCIKIYNYRWKARAIATTEARFELERFLHLPCLPIRISETRDYKANYYSTTLSGVWASLGSEKDDDNTKAEPGFPSSGELNLKGIGRLPYTILVFTEEVNTRRVPHGVFYVFNGQVHGQPSREFISRRLKFDYLKNHLLVSADCTNMDRISRENFLMGSRDRIRQNEISEQIAVALEEELRNHAGLRALNAARRIKNIERALEKARDATEAFQHLLKSDPSLAGIFTSGTHLVTATDTVKPTPYEGKKFPTFFRLKKEPKDGLVKHCAVNSYCRVDFETNAGNNYFKRLDSPGAIEFIPADICEHWNLWNGKMVTRFVTPPGNQAGDIIRVQVKVTDIECEAYDRPFICELTIIAERASEPNDSPSGKDHEGGDKGQGKQTAPRLAIPHIEEIRREQWNDFEPPFTEFDAVKIRQDGSGGYDFYVNLDNSFLRNEISKNSEDQGAVTAYWFTFGLVISAIGMLQQLQGFNQKTPVNSIILPSETQLTENDPITSVEQACAGLARVIIPIIRRLYRGPDN